MTVQPNSYGGFRRTVGDATGKQLAILVPDIYRVLHIASAADEATDWAVANPTNPTVYIHSETTPASNYLSLSATAISFNGDVTLTYATDVLTFSTSKAAANMADGYGCWEVDTTMTGTATGHFAASSSWVNMVSGTAESTGAFVTPHNDGLYEDSAYTITGAFLVMGQRMSAILGETGYTALTLWSVNSNRTITALFEYNSAGALGITNGAHSSAVSGSVAFCRDSNGNVRYIRLHDTAA